MELEWLSEIELYFSSIKDNDRLKIKGEEAHHILDVMRHRTGDELFVTNGKGFIYKAFIEAVGSDEVICKIIETKQYNNPLVNITFCIPRLKSHDRFEFALEKCVELGITNFIIFESARSVSKGEKLERWQKVLISAMKQSLHAWLPQLTYMKNVRELNNFTGFKIILEQASNTTLNNFLSSSQHPVSSNYYFIFGPEGGLTEKEINSIENHIKVRLIKKRLRSETAIIYTVSLLSNLFDH